MDFETAVDLIHDLGGTKIKSRSKGDDGIEVTFCCPIHEERNPSAALNLDKHAFNCFVCGGMDLQQLVMEVMEYDSYGEAQEYLDQFDIEGVTDYDKGKAVAVSIGDWGSDGSAEDPTLPVSFFEHWGTSHKYIERRIPSASVREELGVHFDSDKQRAIFPVHNVSGKIVGWSERWAFDPRYDGRDLVLPRHVIRDLDTFGGDFEEWEVRNPRWRHEWEKAKHLYGAHLVKKKKRSDRTIIVVEGFTTLAWMRCQGIKNVVALGGSKISKHQAELLLTLGTTVVAALDNDGAGHEGTEKLIQRVASYAPVYVVNWDDDEKDFDGLDKDLIIHKITTADNYLSRRIGL